MVLFHTYSIELAFFTQYFYEIHPFLSLWLKVITFHCYVLSYDNTTLCVSILLLMETYFQIFAVTGSVI